MNMILLVTELIFIVSSVNKENVLVVTHRNIEDFFSKLDWGHSARQQLVKTSLMASRSPLEHLKLFEKIICQIFEETADLKYLSRNFDFLW